jgi:Cysteine rich repeat
MFKRVLVISVALLLFGSVALAQGAARSCAADIKTHCAGEEPGKGRIAGCIKMHLSELSTPCQDLLAATAAAAKVCTDDVKQRCADASRRSAKLVCIKSALTSLSDDCKSAISKVAAGRK